MQTLDLPYDLFLHFALFCDISNAAALRRRLIDASTLPDDEAGNAERSRVDYAFIDASTVRSSSFVDTACGLIEERFRSCRCGTYGQRPNKL